MAKSPDHAQLYPPSVNPVSDRSCLNLLFKHIDQGAIWHPIRAEQAEVGRNYSEQRAARSSGSAGVPSLSENPVVKNR
jgi:hypothetical protein